MFIDQRREDSIASWSGGPCHSSEMAKRQSVWHVRTEREVGVPGPKCLNRGVEQGSSAFDTLLIEEASTREKQSKEDRQTYLTFPSPVPSGCALLLQLAGLYQVHTEYQPGCPCHA